MSPNEKWVSDFRDRTTLITYINDISVPFFRESINVAYKYGRWAALLLRVNQFSETATPEVCPTCWDPYGQVSKDPECPTCGGTGYIDANTGGGYLPLQFRRIILPETPESLDRSRRGIGHADTFGMWVDYCEQPMGKGDVVFLGAINDEENPTALLNIKERFVVNEVTHLFLTPTNQILSQQVQAMTAHTGLIEEELLENITDTEH